MKDEIWDYKKWLKFKTNSTYTQHEWNQTLITKINLISAQISRITMWGGGDTIEISSKLKSLIGNLEYSFVDRDKVISLSHRYNIVINDDLDDNIIKVSRKLLFPLTPNIDEPNVVNDTFGIVKIISYTKEDIELEDYIFNTEIRNNIKIIKNAFDGK